MFNKALKYRFGLALAILLLAVMVSPLAAGEIFVSDNGSDLDGDGSEGSPYLTIANAIGQSSLGDTITVMPGTYTPSFTYLYNSLHIRGQYGADSSFLEGSGTNVIFIMDDNSDGCVIQGLTFRNAATAITISYCTVSLYENHFINNSSDSSGGALNIYYADGFIYDNLFQGNSAEFSGGAVLCNNADMYIYNNIFDSNTTTGTFGRGGALAVSGPFEAALLVIQNNIFRFNQATVGAGISCASDLYVIANNLFYQNTSTNLGGGIQIEYDYSPAVYNNIFYGNSPDGMYSNASSLPEYGYNNYYANTPLNDCQFCPTAPGNMYINPYLADIAGGDYHLTDSSAMVNMGLTALPLTLNIDFEGQKRTLAGVMDIGPDEYADCSIDGNFGAITDTAGCAGLEVQFAATSLEGYYDSLKWEFGDGFFDYNITSPVHVYSDTGHFTVKLHLVTPCTTVVITKENFIHSMSLADPDFTADAPSGCAPLQVAFSDQTLGSVDTYSWNFGDGSPVSTAQNPVHTYEEPGTYTVTLTVQNSCGGAIETKESYITVQSAAIADFDAEPLAGSAPLNVFFSDLSQYDPLSWNWDFGDGSISEEQNPTYQYLLPGIYDVSLVVQNACADQPDTMARNDYIRVYGFKAENYSTIEIDRYTYRFNLFLDSLYGLFNRTVSYRASLLNNPGRGNVSFIFGDSTVNLFDSTFLRVQLSKDVPRGTYDVVVRAIGQGGFPVDTLMLQFTADSDSLLETNPIALDFGEVPEDSTKQMTLTLRNNVQFPDTFSVIVSDIEATPNVFSAEDPGQFKLDLVNRTREITVSFTPTAVQNYNGSVLILSNDPAYPQLTVPLTGSGIIERTPPIVDSTRPADNDREYAVTDVIEIYFSEPLDPSTIDGSIIVFSEKSGEQVAGTVSLATGNDMLVFTPTMGFAITDSITVTVDASVADVVGNTLDGNGNGIGDGTAADDYSFSFTTGLAVFPGDANNDGIVNEMDVLPLGVFWGLTGDQRSGNPNVWSRQAATSWSPVRATYADCNGDGVINASDIDVISDMWGSTHAIEGSPTVFTMDELGGSTNNFGQIDDAIENNDLGDNGDKVSDLISNYISDGSNIERFSLGRNYPNPFNPVTTIDFTIPYECHVKLEVYNVLGQTVKMLVDETLPGGYKTVAWDATDSYGNPVPSGIYFYRMSAEDFHQVKKMLLIR